MLNQAWTTNDDGAGIAWREPAEDGDGIEVVWEKGLNLDQAKALAAKVPLPYVIHFRSASQGGIWPELTHPFEVSEESRNLLKGRSKNPVLFHNGTWGNWADKSMEAAIRSGVNVPLGLWSDSRAIAWMSSPGVCGWGFMNFLPEQRGVILGPDWMNVFRSKDGWVEVTDAGNIFWCSNDRPWKTTNVGYQGTYRNNRHNYQSNVCMYGQCKNTNIDGHGYCPLHPGGRSVPAASNPIALVAAPKGGAPNFTPFVSQTPLRQVTLEEIQDLHTKDQISKSFLKAVLNMFDRMTNPKLSKGQQQKARENLDLVTRSLTGSGRLKLTPQA